jgi:hypothetical protein
LAQPIVPFAQPLVICDDYSPGTSGKLNLLDCFHTIRSDAFPHDHEELCVVAHLAGGSGTVSVFNDIRNASTGDLVFCTVPHSFHLPSRETVVRFVNRLENVPFSQPGIYPIELYCENTPIADFRLRLAELAAG